MKDVARLVADGVVGGALPPNETWQTRIEGWLTEMAKGRRLVMVADDGRKLLGVAQLVFRLPEGRNDPEAANGVDIAMVETLRASTEAPPNLATEMINELESYAKRHRIKTITFLVPMDNNRVLAQVKGWGFEEFRIMPEGARLLAFFKKAI
jgi:ribosomal protein S18 acetylase RimI-like enzyme